MPKRIHELAKEWNLQSKELLASLETLGISGKRSQSSLQEPEVERLALQLGRGPSAEPTVGTERVVGERMVTEKDGQGEVTSRESTVEARVRPNVIRRRRRRVEVGRKDTAPSDIGGSNDGSLIDFPDMGSSSDSSTGSAEPSGLIPDLPPSDVGIENFTTEPAPTTEAPAVDEVASADTAATTRATVSETAAEASAETAAPPEPATVEPKPGELAAAGSKVDESPSEPVAPEPPAPTPEVPQRTSTLRPAALIGDDTPALDDGMRRVQVLGKIELKTAPAPAPAGGKPGPGSDAPPATEGRRKKGKKVIRRGSQMDPFSGGDRPRGRRPQKRRATPGKEQQATQITVPSARKRIVRMHEVISVGELAKSMGLKAGEVLKKLMEMGVMATVNQSLDVDHATLVAGEFEYTVENVAFDADKEIDGTEAEEAVGEPLPRDPVVTVMGHVDHGKTSVLDQIRSTTVADGEAGGITQHIGAYSVPVGERNITFIDTPGHAAFTSMRARGAQVTDIVILVVAADDGPMPQTIEAINHSRAAKVPMIVALNKIDRAEADIEKVKGQLAEHGLAPEEWGGDTIFCPVSAKTREGLDNLLEMVLLQAELLELKANPEVRARGTVVESKLDRGRGPVATVLVQEGTLEPGQSFVVGLQHGKLRAMLDSQGNRIKKAGPSVPVEILGLDGVPAAGDAFAVVQDEAKSKQIAEHRQQKQRETELARSSKVSLDDLYSQLEKAKVKELNVVLKVDVQGSVDALREAFSRVSNDEVQVKTIHASVGGITESDVLLASASNAVIIGFNVRPLDKAAALAEAEGVDLRLYTIIYDAIREVREALEGMLAPSLRERNVGRAEVREIFGVRGAGVIAGSTVTDGKILRGSLARLLRDHAVVHEGKIGSLRRFKDDVREVTHGYECGIGIEGFSDVKPGDVVEVYEVEEVARKIEPSQVAGPSQVSDAAS
ncbi:translation initiation factor IF-2 [bacterium]|jgi:translation initiation factor IF-2|nr:translation initiation factor IF-2 [bacterium]MDC0292473.1 translation initiation factor IF-2 [Candidatus Binatia bacterium]